MAITIRAAFCLTPVGSPSASTGWMSTIATCSAVMAVPGSVSSSVAARSRRRWRSASTSSSVNARTTRVTGTPDRSARSNVGPDAELDGRLERLVGRLEVEGEVDQAGLADRLVLVVLGDGRLVRLADHLLGDLDLDLGPDHLLDDVERDAARPEPLEVHLGALAAERGVDLGLEVFGGDGHVEDVVHAVDGSDVGLHRVGRGLDMQRARRLGRAPRTGGYAQASRRDPGGQ